MRRFVEKITGSDYFLIAILLVLGTLSYGWVFSPVLGRIWTTINGIAVVGIVLAAIFYRIGRHYFGKSVIVPARDIVAKPVHADNPVLTPAAVRSADAGKVCHQAPYAACKKANGEQGNAQRHYREVASRP